MLISMPLKKKKKKIIRETCSLILQISEKIIVQNYHEIYFKFKLSKKKKGNNILNKIGHVLHHKSAIEPGDSII